MSKQFTTKRIRRRHSNELKFNKVPTLSVLYPNYKLLQTEGSIQDWQSSIDQEWNTKNLLQMYFYHTVFKIKVSDILNLLNLDKTKLYRQTLLEKTFELFNSDKNPLFSEEKQYLINKISSHISMSVGDIIMIDKDIYQLSGLGFKQRKEDALILNQPQL